MARRAAADPVTAYARAVLAGRIVAGPHVRNACARHLRDLEEGPKSGLRRDLKAARYALGFFPDVLRLAGGQFEGLPFQLQPSQTFIVGSLFGWKRKDGTRRFRTYPFRKFHPDWHWRHEAESSHPCERCLRSCTRSEVSPPTCLNRGAGLRPRICFSVISWPSLCGALHRVFDCVAVIVRCSYGRRAWPSLLGGVRVVQPETVLRWHRAGFKKLWRWKSRKRAERPRIDRGLRVGRIEARPVLGGLHHVYSRI